MTGTKLVKLGDIATITRGGNLQKKDFTDTGIPCIHYGQIYTKYNKYLSKTISFISPEKAKKEKFAEPGDIIMAITSENVEDICKSVAWLGNEKVAISAHTVIIHHNQNPKYLSYFFSSEFFYKQKIHMIYGTKVKDMPPEKLKEILVPIPDIETQAKIVEMLDTLSELTDNLSTELMLEIENRKKQYNYYKNKIFDYEE